MQHLGPRTNSDAHWHCDGSRIFDARRACKWSLFAVACFLLSVGPARSEYHIDAGDVIEIFVARVPDLQRRVTVKLDGSISFPLLGTLPAAGLSPRELQVRVQSILAIKVFQQRAADGREIEIAINPADIMVTVVEYRPVYVNGDVAKPGEYGYRPFMTARQVVAMSGGYDILRAGARHPLIELADLRSTYASLWAELAKEQVQVWRIKSELGDKDNVDQDVLLDVPLSCSAISQIVRVEAEQLALRQADHQRQKAFLQSSIEQGEKQIAVLTQQQEKEEQGAQVDSEELKKVLELYGRGALPSPRVTDARRAVLLSSTRLLQTTSQLMNVRRQQEDLAKQLQGLDDQRKIDLLRQLGEATARIGVLRARLEGVSEKLQHTTGRTLFGSGHEAKPEIAVVRRRAKGRERIAANEDFELQPGDVVEIALRIDHGHAAPDSTDRNFSRGDIGCRDEGKGHPRQSGGSGPVTRNGP